MEALQQLIAGRLKELGWRFRAPPQDSGSARKRYATAVGPKDAIVYLASAAESVSLTADYQSEGGNALSTLWVRIEKTSDSTAVQNAVEAFSRAADDGVAETYAARLLKLGWQAPPLMPRNPDGDFRTARAPAGPSP